MKNMSTAYLIVWRVDRRAGGRTDRRADGRAGGRTQTESGDIELREGGRGANPRSSWFFRTIIFGGSRVLVCIMLIVPQVRPAARRAASHTRAKVHASATEQRTTAHGLELCAW